MRSTVLLKSGVAVVSVLLAVGGLARLVGAPGPDGKNDWPCYRGPNHDGVSKEAGWQAKWPAGGPNVLWKKQIGVGFSSFAVCDGRLYTMGNAKVDGKDTDFVYCLDAAKGDKVWEYSYPCPRQSGNYEGGPSATPTVDGGKVYTLSKTGLLLCLSADKGEVVWKHEIAKEFHAHSPQWGFASSVLILDKQAIVNAGSAGMSFDKTTGDKLWISGEGTSGYSTPVPFTYNGKTALALMGAKHLIALSADGKELWQFPWQTEYDVNAADPLIFGSKMFISSGYNHGGAVVDFSGPKPKADWQNREMRNQFSTSVYFNGFVYGFDDTNLKCIDAKTGKPAWSEGQKGQGAVTIADGKLIVLVEGQLIVAEASPKAFTPISSAAATTNKCWTAPVLANGRMYVRNAKSMGRREGGVSQIVCLDVSGK